jgi:hypothetical protein
MSERGTEWIQTVSCVRGSVRETQGGPYHKLTAFDFGPQRDITCARAKVRRALFALTWAYHSRQILPCSMVAQVALKQKRNSLHLVDKEGEIKCVNCEVRLTTWDRFLPKSLTRVCRRPSGLIPPRSICIKRDRNSRKMMAGNDALASATGRGHQFGGTI